MLPFKFPKPGKHYAISYIPVPVMFVRLAGYLDMTGSGLGPYCIKEKNSSSIMTKLL